MIPAAATLVHAFGSGLPCTIYNAPGILTDRWADRGWLLASPLDDVSAERSGQKRPNGLPGPPGADFTLPFLLDLLFFASREVPGEGRDGCRRVKDRVVDLNIPPGPQLLETGKFLSL